MRTLKTATVLEGIHVVGTGTLGPVLNVNPAEAGPRGIMSLSVEDGLLVIELRTSRVLVPLTFVKSMVEASAAKVVKK